MVGMDSMLAGLVEDIQQTKDFDSSRSIGVTFLASDYPIALS